MLSNRCTGPVKSKYKCPKNGEAHNAILKFADKVPADKIVIGESGVHDRRDVEHNDVENARCFHGVHGRRDVDRLRVASVYAYLVGEALMVADDPGARLKTLFFD